MIYAPSGDSSTWASAQSDQSLAKTQISMGIRPVWSESSLCAQRVAKDPRLLRADIEDSDQTGRMHSLIWVFAGSHMPFCWFCHEAAQVSKTSCNLKKKKKKKKRV